jgi:hypothetical protein
MVSKRKVGGGILTVVGYLLSPLSWWNDLVINLPLALVFGWLVSWFYKPAFEVCVIAGYWLTNILGLVLMHKGAQQMMSNRKRGYSWRDLVKDIGVSLLYTALIVLLLKLRIIAPLTDYLEKKRADFGPTRSLRVVDDGRVARLTYPMNAA